MLDEPRESPMEVALNFTCAMFTTPEAVLKGARHMVWDMCSIFVFVPYNIKTCYVTLC